MDNSYVDKKMVKQKNREATIKHYILGYILECAVKNDANVTVNIRKLLVYKLKIISAETFISCLHKARVYRMLNVKGSKKNYSEFKKTITLIEYDKAEQIKIIQELQEFANNYEKGLFVNSEMGKSSFVGVKYKVEEKRDI